MRVPDLLSSCNDRERLLQLFLLGIVGKMGTFIADLVLQVLSFVSQNERENIRRRQEQGIAAAREKGVRFGRPRIPISEEFETLVCLWKDGEISRREIEEKYQISTSTFYRRLRDSLGSCQPTGHTAGRNGTGAAPCR